MGRNQKMTDVPTEATVKRLRALGVALSLEDALKLAEQLSYPVLVIPQWETYQEPVRHEAPIGKRPPLDPLWSTQFLAGKKRDVVTIWHTFIQELDDTPEAPSIRMPLNCGAVVVKYHEGPRYSPL
jgi:hypothetical protein